MTSWGKQSAQEPSVPSAPARPEVVVQIELLASRIFFEETLLLRGDKNPGATLQRLADDILETEAGVHEVRLYPYYIAASHLPLSGAVIVPKLVSVLSEQLKWPQAPRIELLLNIEEVPVADNSRHPGQPKWSIGRDPYRERGYRR